MLVNRYAGNINRVRSDYGQNINELHVRLKELGYLCKTLDQENPGQDLLMMCQEDLLWYAFFIATASGGIQRFDVKLINEGMGKVTSFYQAKKTVDNAVPDWRERMLESPRLSFKLLYEYYKDPKELIRIYDLLGGLVQLGTKDNMEKRFMAFVEYNLMLTNFAEKER